MAMDPSLVADKGEREPRKPPIGVRATPTTQTSASTENLFVSSQILSDNFKQNNRLKKELKKKRTSRLYRTIRDRGSHGSQPKRLCGA